MSVSVRYALAARYFIEVSVSCGLTVSYWRKSGLTLAMVRTSRRHRWFSGNLASCMQPGSFPGRPKIELGPFRQKLQNMPFGFHY
jgi:hypothetical protein